MAEASQTHGCGQGGWPHPQQPAVSIRKRRGYTRGDSRRITGTQCRRRLLLQPHGFEGLRTISEPLDPRDTSPGECEDSPEPCLELDAAVPPYGDPAGASQDVTARVQDLVKLVSVFLPRVLEPPALTNPRIPPDAHLSVWPVLWGKNDDMRIMNGLERRPVVLRPDF